MTIDIGELAALRERCGELENRTDAQARELAALTDHIRALRALRDKDAKTIAALRATCRDIASVLRLNATMPKCGEFCEITAKGLNAMADRLDPPAQGTEVA